MTSITSLSTSIPINGKSKVDVTLTSTDLKVSTVGGERTLYGGRIVLPAGKRSDYIIDLNTKEVASTSNFRVEVPAAKVGFTMISKAKRESFFARPSANVDRTFVADAGLPGCKVTGKVQGKNMTIAAKAAPVTVGEVSTTVEGALVFGSAPEGSKVPRLNDHAFKISSVYNKSTVGVELTKSSCSAFVRSSIFGVSGGAVVKHHYSSKRSVVSGTATIRSKDGRASGTVDASHDGTIGKVALKGSVKLNKNTTLIASTDLSSPIKTGIQLAF